MKPKKIIGGTVGMGLPKPNLMQTDPTKGDFVKGKDEFLRNVGGIASDGVTLKDQTTGKKYALYVTAGKLTMEEAATAAQSVDGVQLVDAETGKHYNIYISGGKLSMEGIDE